MSEDELLASAFRKLLTDCHEQRSVWWYDGEPATDEYVPVSLGVDAQANLTEQEALAVQRAMGGLDTPM